MVEKGEVGVVLEGKRGTEERGVWVFNGQVTWVVGAQCYPQRWLLLLGTGGLEMEPGMD